ncbi:MAG: RsmB/NOP family class I SAM-dependent RNA methyltransferase [Blautia sp.]|nr:RsmB/NOP family class I SAM-dependent RNA methyltransferase [Blautia sp.]
MADLPQAFAVRMRELLGDEYPAFEASFDMPRSYGLRVNTSKITCEEFEKIVPFAVERIPWLEAGYFYDPESRPARCPLYQAGLYYLQDPGAMTPASFLRVEPGMKILDLCAAPGGKATAAGAALQAAGSLTGLLAANDISPQRARALLRNLELFGIRDMLVTSCAPAELSAAFPPVFDRIILDAPCSGEGMFRKEEALLADWSEEKSRALSVLQRELILLCADLLAPGGELLYSTCTYSPWEDEEVVAFLLSERPGMRLLPPPVDYPGFSPGIIPGCASEMDPEIRETVKNCCVRIYPHRMRAEGHFMALLQKKRSLDVPVGTDPGVRDSDRTERDDGFPCQYRSKSAGREKKGKKPQKRSGTAQPGIGYFQTFIDELGLSTIGGDEIRMDRLEVRADRLYYIPPAADTAGLSPAGLSFLRYGLYLGDLKKDRFEPSEPFALALHRGEAVRSFSLALTDPRLTAWLTGQSLTLTEEEAGHIPGGNGWMLICAEGYPISFGKRTANTIKNKLPSGWRTMS